MGRRHQAHVHDRARGQTLLADKQIALQFVSKYRRAEDQSSLIYEQELIAEKPRTDLYLNATAHAPRRRAATEFHVSLHRIDPRNPVGTGFFTSGVHRVGELLPSVEPASGDHEGGPAGFGALCGYWESRIKFQGTNDAMWVNVQKPLLPTDYDTGFLQCSPVDQQFGPYLRGGEDIGLRNLTPEDALQFRLPKRVFAFTTHIGRRRFEHRAKLVPVVIEPDHPRVFMV
ncbi:DUF2169 domain-containing protein [Sorangium sp. So ce388]|uniref:DUF2169 domain-containing protein n=1 Tax=Sorangium sp. So ce388 TaxID=3133309 RepID=UPI003F5C134E